MPQLDERIPHVYFIHGAVTGRIKIGVSSSPVRRLRNLQIGSAEKLQLLFYVRGGVELEDEIHKRFSYLRIAGEWFEPDKALTDFMTSLWQNRQAHRASFMGYDKERFMRILIAKGYSWSDIVHINAALYWEHDPSHAAVKEFRPARVYVEPNIDRDLFTPQELDVFDRDRRELLALSEAVNELSMT